MALNSGRRVPKNVQVTPADLLPPTATEVPFVKFTSHLEKFAVTRVWSMKQDFEEFNSLVIFAERYSCKIAKKSLIIFLALNLVQQRSPSFSTNEGLVFPPVFAE